MVHQVPRVVVVGIASIEQPLDDRRIRRDLRLVIQPITNLGHHVVLDGECAVVHLRLLVNRLRNTLPWRVICGVLLMPQRLRLVADRTPSVSTRNLSLLDVQNPILAWRRADLRQAALPDRACERISHRAITQRARHRRGANTDGGWLVQRSDSRFYSNWCVNVDRACIDPPYALGRGVALLLLIKILHGLAVVCIGSHAVVVDCVVLRKLRALL